MKSANKSSQLSYYIMGITVCSLAVLFYAYEFTVRTIPSAITHELMQDFNITAAGLGVLTSLFYYGYTIMQIPVGLMFDAINVRKILLFAMGGCTFGTFLFGIAPNVYIADFAFFIVGFSASFAFVGCLVLASRLFPAKYYAMITGIVQLIGCLGAIVGQAPIALLAGHYGWRHTMMFATVLGLAIFVLMCVFLKGNNQPAPKVAVSLDSRGELKRFKEVSKNPQTWWIALYSYTSWAPILVFAGLWGVPFLMTLYHTDAAIAGAGTTVIWIGIAVGSPLIGWWSDRIKRRCLPLALCSFLGVVSSVLAIYCSHLSWMLMYVLLFVFGFAAAGQALSFGVVQDNNPPRVSGTATGINNMAVIIGGIVLQPLVGFILKSHWHGEMWNHAPVYSLSDYHLALLIVPLSSLLGLIVAMFFLKETHCRPQYEAAAERSDAVDPVSAEVAA